MNLKINNAHVSDVIEIKSTDKEKYPSKLQLVLVYEDILGDESEIEVKLAETEIGLDEYTAKYAQKVFNEINSQLGLDLKLPDEITKESMIEALDSIKDKDLKLYPYEFENKNEKGESYKVSGYTLVQGSSFEYARANAKVGQFFDEHPETAEKVIEGKFVGFVAQDHKKFYNSKTGEWEDSVIKKGTETRKGLMKYFLKQMKSPENEDSKKAKQIINNLETLNKKRGDKVSTQEILQAVGVFSTGSRNIGDLDTDVVSLLGNAINFTSSNHADLGSYRLLFNIDMDNNNELIYQTSENKAPTWKTTDPKSLNWKTTYNPDDFISRDFLNLLNPMMDKGFLSADDVKEFKKLANNETSSYKVLMWLSNKLIEHNAKVKVKISGLVKDKKTDEFKTATYTRFELVDIVAGTDNAENHKANSDDNSEEEKQEKNETVSKDKQDKKLKEEIVEESSVDDEFDDEFDNVDKLLDDEELPF